MAVCERHPGEEAEATCGHCRYSFCDRCLVFPFGPKKPPYCVACALTLGGVRSTAARSARPVSRRRTWRRRRVDEPPAPTEEVFRPLEL